MTQIPVHDQQPPEGFKYHGFTITTDLEFLVHRFIERHAAPPNAIYRWRGLLWAGPVVIDDPESIFIGSLDGAA